MSWILLIVLLLLVAATGYALYTRQGSGISNHPIDDAGPPEHPDREGDAELQQPGIDRSDGPDVSQRGTDSTAG
ncbi:MAG TPA: hypothetical protein VKA36_00480 [Solirubrobacterales bacterium]|nr:hypothetical protein [Solirubrobacterales bacterium]